MPLGRAPAYGQTPLDSTVAPVPLTTTTEERKMGSSEPGVSELNWNGAEPPIVRQTVVDRITILGSIIL